MLICKNKQILQFQNYTTLTRTIRLIRTALRLSLIINSKILCQLVKLLNLRLELQIQSKLYLSSYHPNDIAQAASRGVNIYFC